MVSFVVAFQIECFYLLLGSTMKMSRKNHIWSHISTGLFISTWK